MDTLWPFFFLTTSPARLPSIGIRFALLRLGRSDGGVGAEAVRSQRGELRRHEPHQLSPDLRGQGVRAGHVAAGGERAVGDGGTKSVI